MIVVFNYCIKEEKLAIYHFFPNLMECLVKRRYFDGDRNLFENNDFRFERSK